MCFIKLAMKLQRKSSYRIFTALVCAILMGACTMVTSAAQPDYVTALAAAYGPPSQAAFDDPAVTELAVYKIGDGAAMAGLLVAARRAATGETVTLVFLLD
jgi:hypothetical protein